MNVIKPTYGGITRRRKVWGRIMKEVNMLCKRLILRKMREIPKQGTFNGVNSLKIKGEPSSPKAPAYHHREEIETNNVFALATSPPKAK